MEEDRRGINALRSLAAGCVECLASLKGWWFGLRGCAKCGHIGCCDSSLSQHASKRAAGHPIIASFEPGEDWFFDYEKRGMIKGVELLLSHSHPEDPPAPGPAGRLGIAAALAASDPIASLAGPARGSSLTQLRTQFHISEMQLTIKSIVYEQMQ